MQYVLREYKIPILNSFTIIYEKVKKNVKVFRMKNKIEFYYYNLKIRLLDKITVKVKKKE